MLRLSKNLHKGGKLSQKLHKNPGYAPMGQGPYTPNAYNTIHHLRRDGNLNNPANKSRLSAHYDDIKILDGDHDDAFKLSPQKLDKSKAILIKNRIELGQTILDNLAYMKESQENYKKIEKLNNEIKVYPVRNSQGEVVKNLDFDAASESAPRRMRTRRVGRRMVGGTTGSISVKRWNKERVMEGME